MTRGGGRILIIGGGPAGSAAAFHLARAGFGVTLVEARAFPRHKVCGEFVSPAATEFLEAIVPADRLRAAGAAPVREFVLEVRARERAWPLPSPAWALSRASLDALLLGAAAGAGAQVLQPATAQRIEYGARGVRAFAASEGRPLPPINAAAVIHADGSGRHDPAGPVGHDRGLVALKCHLRGRVRGVRIRACRGAYVGAMSVEDGLIACALAARKGLLRTAGDADALLGALWPDAPAREGPWLSSGVARSAYRRPGHPRSLRIGNAAGAVDPIGGEGIGLALWSGTILADLMAERRPEDLAAFAATERLLARAYTRRLRWRRRSCRAAAAMLGLPGLVGAAGPLLELPGLGISLWYAMTGKRPARRATVGPCTDS